MEHTGTHTHPHNIAETVLILVGAEILGEEEGFQFGFKVWHGWAVTIADYNIMCYCVAEEETDCL